MSISTTFSHERHIGRTVAFVRPLDRAHDPLNAARGVLFGAALGLMAWIGIIALFLAR